ncbi:MAG: PKD domain-containing protein [Tannerella sp.]|jgi:hypothetical protein|nr:PKD domain-containing protein [Tannerella sp.]
MNKISTSKIYIIAIAIFFCLAVALIIRLFLNNREPEALVTPLELYLGDPVFYMDSTYLASQWYWEFGNGETSAKRSGEYRYGKAGTYQIRLTVDNSIEKSFLATVRTPVNLDSDSLIQIAGPSTAIQGEYVVFRGLGYAREWRWEFGETGLTDSREQVSIYAYERIGRHSVQLMTENTKYPVTHTITILPKYREEENDERTRIGNDIRQHLQAIVDGKPFSTHYNYILNTYLCNNPNILITINEEKSNDFYSYCQGLKIIDRKVTTILEVIVFPRENNDETQRQCLKTFKVMQVKNDIAR